MNAACRHLCYVGGLAADGKTPLDTRTPAQTKAMTDIIAEVLGYAPKVKVAGHNQFAQKGCPSFFVPVWLEQVGVPAANIERRDPYGYERYYKKLGKR